MIRPPSPDPHALLERLEAIISPVYLVGGSVRDILLGKTPHDYDITTPRTPDEIEASLRMAGFKPYLVGKKYGTISCKIDGQLLEITTFRTERYLTGSRKPVVTFIDDITHDLSRRDFTINAMAMRWDGKLIDPFGGQTDLTHGLIRTVNKAYDRYNEDPLRMLRAARLASQLDFEIDADAVTQAAKKVAKILEISKERWVQELDKLLMTPHPEIGLHFLARTRLLHYMLPELAIQVDYNQDSPYHELSLLDHTIKTVQLTDGNLHLRWAALLHDVGKPYVRKKNKRGYSNYTNHELIGGELVMKIGSYLRWPTERTNNIATMVRHHLAMESPLHRADSAARFR
jgi:tRNA nucleotidyltransferase/poly(A) polymerase